MFNLGLLLGLLLTSALATFVVYVVRPRQTRPVALVGTALLCFAWLVARDSLPHSLTIGAEASGWLTWSWQVGPLSWTLSLAVLLLALGALALDAKQDRRQSSGPGDAGLIQLFLLVALLACWAGNLTTYVMTWTLLAVLWAAAMTLSATVGQPRSSLLARRVGTASGSVFLLWLAAASAGPDNNISSVHAWPTLTRALVLLAATYQLGVFPLHHRTWRDWSLSPSRSALLLGAPTVAGAVLLARLEAGSEIGLAFSLPMTLLGLLALLSGVRRAWVAADMRAALPFALIQGQAGMVLLAGVWTGPQAVVAESLLLLLGGGVLILGSNTDNARFAGGFPQPGLVIAAAAFAALPLTVGFTGHSSIYGSWLEQGRWILVLATALLQLPLLAALLVIHIPIGDDGDMLESERLSRPALPRLLALLLPTLGLFSWTSLSEMSPITWFAVLTPPVLAGLLIWRIREESELIQTVREAMSFPAIPSPVSASSVRHATRSVAIVFRNAVALLEGEGGLLWLLLFVVILSFVR